MFSLQRLILGVDKFCFSYFFTSTNHQIGEVNTANTEFNVGSGSTDETASLNRIQISDTPGITAGLSNNPGTDPGTTYYRFTVLAPGCGSQGDPAVQIKTSYDTDGHLTGLTTVDFELSVNAWIDTHYAIQSEELVFGVCIQADILIIDGGSNPQVVESKQFDFRVTPILSTFTVSSASLNTNEIVISTTDNLRSGTEVTPVWASRNPLAPGEAVWFYLTIDTAPYVFVNFEEVQMIIGGGDPIILVAGGVIQDTALTSFELGNNATAIHLYHILLRSRFTDTQQQIALTGRANVAYPAPPSRRLDSSTENDVFSVNEDESQTLGAESKISEISEEQDEVGEIVDFAVRAMLLPYEDEEEDSGNVRLGILSTMIGGAGLVGAAVLL